MALVDEARQVAGTKGPPCTVGGFMAKLDADQRREVDDALAHAADRDVPEVTYESVSKALVERNANKGWPKPPQTYTLRRHYSGGCSCG